MSTYYKMACLDCKERCNAAATGSIYFKGVPLRGGFIDSPEVLPQFLMHHCGCRLKCAIEDSPEYSDDGWLEWDEANLETMLDRDTPAYVRDRKERPWAYGIGTEP